MVSRQVMNNQLPESDVSIRVRPIVVLVGPPGAGKTTVGRRLANALNTLVVDSDVLIEQHHGKPCGVVFTELGEPDFRALEAEVIDFALTTAGVVSLGGGAVITESVRQKLREQIVVWIDVSAEEGVRRTAVQNSRPLLDTTDPLECYSELLDQRRDFYKEVADYRAHTDGRSQQQIVADILGFLETLR